MEILLVLAAVSLAVTVFVAPTLNAASESETLMMGPNPKIHYLPLAASEFEKLHYCQKNFHINDQDYPRKVGEFEVGDLVMFMEVVSVADSLGYSGNEKVFQIGYLSYPSPSEGGLAPGYCAFSLVPADAWHYASVDGGDVESAHFPEVGERVLIEGLDRYHWATFDIERPTNGHEPDRPVFTRDDGYKCNSWTMCWIPETLWKMYKGHRIA